MTTPATSSSGLSHPVFEERALGTRLNPAPWVSKTLSLRGSFNTKCNCSFLHVLAEVAFPLEV